MSILSYSIIPSEFYTNEEVMNFAYHIYKAQCREPEVFVGVKFPASFQGLLSYEHGSYRIYYWGRLIGTIDLLTDRITYSK